MKIFLTYTALIEALTGLLLMLFPTKVVILLLQSPLEGNASNVAAMLAGAAIFTTACASWILKENPTARAGVKIMFVYNLLVTLLFIYSLIVFELKSTLLWLIIIFHSFQTFFSVFLLQKKEANK